MSYMWVIHEKVQLYGFLWKNGYFVLKCYCQKQYKPNHKRLVLDKVSDKVEPDEKTKKWELCERLANINIVNCSLSAKIINVNEIEDLEVY